MVTPRSDWSSNMIARLIARLIGERAKQARHSQVCSIENRDILEKWFPLQGERAQFLKLFNVRMLGFKNKKEETEQQQSYQFTTRY